MAMIGGHAEGISVPQAAQRTLGEQRAEQLLSLCFKQRKNMSPLMLLVLVLGLMAETAVSVFSAL